ncbi:hypothetical protein ACIQGO_09270 [Streptomyces shenzhenensis]|uniref:hypothetical protein n=1 Tax=Streptomyces shenzhenensis TaxID=943815 RepID=UPI00381B20D5
MDDALDLLHALMATKLPAKAERMGNDAELKALPQLRKAAKKAAAAVDVLMTKPSATASGEMVSVVDAWSAIEQVVPREQLAEALATIAAVVPDTDGDDDAEWRAEPVARYGTVRGFIRLLVEAIDFGAVEAGAPVVKALKQLPDLIGRKKVGAEEVSTELVTGSWRRLVFANPNVSRGLDKAAYWFCILEHLHRSLRRRDVFAGRGPGSQPDPHALLQRQTDRAGRRVRPLRAASTSTPPSSSWPPTVSPSPTNSSPVPPRSSRTTSTSSAAAPSPGPPRRGCDRYATRTRTKMMTAAGRSERRESTGR